MNLMKDKKTKPPQPANDEAPSWAIFARIDPALRPLVEEYIESRDYPPPLARVIERALREFLEREKQRG